ncbi:MAG: tetratricopeptide repeat protein [Alphaproteobacteria bacterium]|nr:tetratricopeptide repeat protein [Alphaproteobacteria bacterium]
MADIFNEIDEELRRDKAQIWWKQYGKYVLAACVVVVLGAGAYTWYQDQQKSEMRALADEYSAAQQTARTGSEADALKAFEELAQKAGEKGIGLVARFQAAGLHIEAGDHAAAAAAFEEIAKDTTVQKLYRDLADVMAIMHSGIAGGDVKALLARIDPLAADGEPWSYTARMVAASLALSSGDMKLAQDYLTKVADDDGAPTSARGQAAEILQAIKS